MAVHEILLDCLNELDSDEMGKFKWHLTKRKRQSIPRSQLEKEEKFAVVDRMIQRFQPEGAVKCTRAILEKMRLMNLAQQLREKTAPKNPAAKMKAKKPSTAASKKATKSHKKAKPTKPKAAKPKATKPKNTAPKKK